MVAGLRPWQLGIFVLLLCKGVIGKEALVMSASIPLIKKGHGSEVKYNRRFLWNHSYMITSGHDPSLEVGFSHPPLAESFGCTGEKLAFNTWREYNSCRSSMTRRVGIHPRVTRPVRMQMLDPSSSRLHSFFFHSFLAEDGTSASIPL